MSWPPGTLAIYQRGSGGSAHRVLARVYQKGKESPPPAGEGFTHGIERSGEDRLRTVRARDTLGAIRTHPVLEEVHAAAILDLGAVVLAAIGVVDNQCIRAREDRIAVRLRRRGGRGKAGEAGEANEGAREGAHFEYVMYEVSAKNGIYVNCRPLSDYSVAYYNLIEVMHVNSLIDC